MRDQYQVNALKQKYKTEKVLVVPAMSANTIPDLFNHNISRATKRLFSKARTFVYRYDAEYNYALVQLISYVIITNTDQDYLFVTERKGGEERLQHKYSLGAGGHVNPDDLSYDTMLTAAERELNEELDIKLEAPLTPYGTVRDFNSPTREHLGLVYVAVASDITVKETDTLRGQWMDVRNLVDKYHSLESWSRHIIDHLFVNNKKTGKLFLPFLETGAKNNDRKRKKTVW